MCSFVHFKLFNSYCMSLYGSQLWNYENKLIMDSVYCYIYIYISMYLYTFVCITFLCHILFPIYVLNYVWVCMCLCVNSLNACNCTHEGANKIFWILNLAGRKCVWCIFNIPYGTHCKLVPLFCQDVAIQIKLYKLFFTILQ